MIQDAQGHHLSGATTEAATIYDQAARAFNLVSGDSLGLFDRAIEGAPDFAMAYLGKAWVFALANDPGLLTQAKTLVETVRPLSLNEREQAHLTTLTHLVQGSRAAAVGVMDRHLMRYPFDLVAHQGAAVTDGFLGRFPWVRDRSARALPFWSKDQSGYGTLLAMHGFGLEEAGDYTRAEDESRAAAELEPLSFWPHHTVAHVMEMTGRPEDGLGWMTAREALWSTPGHMNQVHIWWHKALFHLELGQYDAALALYDGPMRATQRPVALSLTNATHSCGASTRSVATPATAGRSRRICGRTMPTENASCSPTSTPRWPSCGRAGKRSSSDDSRRCARRPPAPSRLQASIAPRASGRSTAAPTPRRSSCCCRFASICGRSAAATRNATSSTGS